MKYYVKKEGGKSKETTREDYYSKKRRKGAKVRTWVVFNHVYAREVILQ